MGNIVTVDSKTSTNGQVLPGSNSKVMINGKALALVGEQATCACGAEHCKGVGNILAMSPRNADIAGKKWALDGDLVNTGCGACFLIGKAAQVELGSNMNKGLHIEGNVAVSIGDGVALMLAIKRWKIPSMTP